jgi:16S rRNA (guanine(1405)-N(7))-methyltransferase
VTPRPAPAEALELVIADLRAARKYRHVAPAVLERLARESLAVEPRPVDAVQRAKTKLHQIHSAFVSERQMKRVEGWIEGLEASDDPAMIEAYCASILASHASTAERPADRAALYRELFALSGRPGSLLDLGCGLHPFALPWMGLARDVPYHAIDLDLRMAALVRRLFSKLGQRGTAEARDLLGDDALPDADVALLMKLLPTLERQEAGAAAKLLDRVRARALVLSFPTASLGRREKGMERHYGELTHRLLAPRGWYARTLSTREELFFVVTTSPRSR